MQYFNLIILFYLLFHVPDNVLCSFCFVLDEKDYFCSSFILEKSPNSGRHFSFVWTAEPDIIACLLPPPPDLKKLVFLRSYDVPAVWSQMARCVDANLFGQAPSTMSCIENTVSKCRFCSIIFNIFWSWNNISGFTFLFQYEFKVMQQTL